MSLPGAGALADAVARGEMTAVDVVEAALSRTDMLIGAEGVGAFLHVDAMAARQAAAVVDRRLADGETLPLAGVPVALKDNLAHAGQPLGCASLILRGHVATRTATAVARLEAAGAIVLGRTNMDELAMGSSTENSAYHTTLNPWDPDRVPGGSSGGSAAAVAMGAVPVALGSDTGGSIRQPAAFCGVVGLRPTWGRVSRHGLFGLADTLDTVGPVARNVRDVARVLQVVAGPDPLEPTASDRPVDDWLAACGASVEGLSVGILMEGLGKGVHPAVRQQVNLGLAALEAAGARLRPVSAPSLQHAAATYQLLAATEAVEHLEALQGNGVAPGADARRSRTDLLGAEAKRRILLGTVLRTEAKVADLLARAQAMRRRITAELLALLEDVDVLACPTAPTVAFRFNERTEDPVDMYLADRLTTPPALAGLPAISVPVGMADLGLGDHMPAGLQLVGRPWGEATVLSLAAVVEAELGEMPMPPRPRL